MRLPRLYVPDLNFAAGMAVPLSAEQSHYMRRVLRLADGAALILFNAQAGDWRGTLGGTDKHAVVTLQDQVAPPVLSADLWLVTALLKKDAWGFLVEKSVELGIKTLQPVLTDYTQAPKLNAERTRANLVEAAQQCERSDVPELLAVKKLDALLASWDAGRILYAAIERDSAPDFATAITAQPAAILIGPEGGFSPREKELLKTKDFVRSISLGPLILRAETAAIAALAVWQGIYRRRHSGQ